MLEISFGRNRSDKNWTVDFLEWPEFINTLELRRTDETMAEYDRLSKEKQGAIKDGPAFVGGLIRSGRRKKVNIESRWLITLDADYADDNFMMDVDLVLGGTDYLIYSTHSHREDGTHKYRLIVPAEREMQLDEYAAVSRKLAENIGMSYFDHTTFQVHRLMYFPSCSKDATPVFEVFEGEPLNVDDVLDEYIDWTDISEWPRHEEESKELILNGKKQQDPTEKKGVVGLFCQTYPIDEGIEEFLSDQYEQGSMENRFTYLHGSSANGLEVFPDQALAYSHQDSDPVADGHSKNLFDLVRLHKFGDLDDNVKKNTPSFKYPSFVAMQELIYELPEIKRALMDKKEASINEDFADDIEDEADKDPDAWKEELTYTKQGNLLNDANNAEILLTNGRLKGILAYDDFKNREVVSGNLPWRKKNPILSHEPWLGADDAQLRHWLGKYYGLKGQGVITDALTYVSRKNSFHPIKDYLESLKWDGVERLDRLLIDYVGANDTEYTKIVTRKMLIAAVKRIYVPGTKFDNVLVLSGGQGSGKSAIISKIGGPWFSDALKKFDSKEAGEYLQNSWIFELAELSAMNKSDVEEVKAFITKTTDMYRVAYDRVISEFPRKCVFFGTTNNFNFLKDQTGNRRFWPVPVDKNKAVKRVLRDEEDPNMPYLTDKLVGQIWAEAKYYCDQGEGLRLPKRLEEEAKKIQDAHMEENPRAGLIQEFLDTPIQEDFMDEPEYRQRVCAIQLWVEALGGRKNDLENWKAKDIVQIMRNTHGWKELEKRKRFKDYGLQTAFERE